MYFFLVIRECTRLETFAFSLYQWNMVISVLVSRSLAVLAPPSPRNNCVDCSLEQYQWLAQPMMPSNVFCNVSAALNPAKNGPEGIARVTWAI